MDNSGWVFTNVPIPKQASAHSSFRLQISLLFFIPQLTKVQRLSDTNKSSMELSTDSIIVLEKSSYVVV